jgi:hypothetical protein
MLGKWRNGAKRLALGVVGVAGVLVLAGQARAAIIRATVVDQHGAPVAQHQIHVENHVSGDSFLATTAADGGFAVDVPPGYYDVRDDTGAILYSDVVATHLATIKLGKITRHNFLWAFLQQEVVAAGIVYSPAPMTAYVIPGNPYIRQTLPPNLQR